MKKEKLTIVGVLKRLIFGLIACVKFLVFGLIAFVKYLILELVAFAKMNKIKLCILAALIFFFAVYQFMPFFVSSMDFGDTMASEVSLSRFVWGPNEYRHIANYIANNYRGSFPMQALSRDVFIAGVVLPVIAIGLIVLLFIAKKVKPSVVIAALLVIWGIGGGIFYLTDPVLNIGGLPYWLMIVAMFLVAIVTAVHGYILFKENPGLRERREK